MPNWKIGSLGMRLTVVESCFEAMMEFYGAEGLTRRRSGIKSAQSDAPAAHRVFRPKVMRNHARKPVNVNPWMPKRVD
jgi:hypothetical protein